MSKRKQHCPSSGANQPMQNMAQVFGGTLGDAGFQWTFEYSPFKMAFNYHDPGPRGGWR
jgi:hypothetical protein